jgi:hypothetical protein
MNTRRAASTIGAAAVAAIAAVASYSHMRSVAIDYGQSEMIATLLPLSVDGLVIVGAAAIGDGRARTWSAWLAFFAGVGASIAANVLAARPEAIARVISAWPAVALLLVVEVLTRSGRGAAQPTAAPSAQRCAAESEDAAPEPLVTLQPVAIRDGYLEVATAPAAGEVEAEPPAQHHAAPESAPAAAVECSAADEVQRPDAAITDLTQRRSAEVSDSAVAEIIRSTAVQRGCSAAELSRREIARLIAAQHPAAPTVGDRRIARIAKEVAA